MSIHRALSELWFYIVEYLGFPGGTHGKEPSCHFRRCKKHGFNPWVGKISWRRAQQPTLVLKPGEYHEQRSLVGYGPRGFKESDMTEVTQHACTVRVCLVL